MLKRMMLAVFVSSKAAHLEKIKGKNFILPKGHTI
jgi:hypothetical protein